MKANFNIFALSKKFIVVTNLVHTSASIYDAIKDFSEEKITLPLQIQYLLMRYGKSLTTDAFLSLCEMDKEDIILIANDIEVYLKELYGDYGTFQTLFGDFPNRVLNMNDVEMALHTLVHYMSGGEYFPNDYSDGFDAEKVEYDWENFDQYREFEMIDAIDMDGLASLYANIISANQSLTSFDTEAIQYLANANKQFCSMVMERIEDVPFKETLCLVIDTLHYSPKTVTDVLRYAVYLSGNDVSLPKIPTTVSNGWSTRRATKEDNIPYNFKNFNRRERRRLLQMLNDIVSTPSKFENGVSEMKKYLARWIRLGEKIHPGEFGKKFPEAKLAFDKIRNEAKSIHGWEGKVEIARQNYDFKAMMKLYKERPGSFARALDSLFRMFGEEETIINEFQSVINKVSTKVLIELAEHFSSRTERCNRFVTPKGARRAIELSSLSPMSSEFVEKIMNCVIQEFAFRASQKEPLTNQHFYLSKQLVNILLPKNMRSAAIGTVQAARGSRIPLPNDKDLIRFYCHWIDETGNEDLDLSAELIHKNCRPQHIGWNTNYRNVNNGETICIFSGDVRRRVGKCAEYIDISISKALEAGFQYMVLYASDYNGKGFQCPCWAGFESREQFGRSGGTTWAPSEVTYGVQITSQCQQIVMGIVDFEKREFIIVDEDRTGIPVSSLGNSDNLIQRFTKPHFWNALKLLEISLSARYADVYEVDDDIKVEEQKLQNNTEIKRLETLLEIYQNQLKDSSLEEVDIDGLNDEIAETLQELEWRRKCQFITCHDTIRDYTLLLESMS